MKLEWFAHTHVGRRTANEDAMCGDSSLGLFAVADGMGGYAGGEVASHLAVTALEEFIENNTRDDDVTWPYGLDKDRTLAENMVAVATRIAHDRITEKRIGELRHMGSTLAVMVVRNDNAVVGHIGDSRVYRMRGGTLTQLTRDHSLYQELVDNGHAVPDPDQFAYSNVVTRALGTTGDPDISTEKILPGDIYLLCTDGLTGPISDDRIARLLESCPIEDAARTLVEEAFDAGGRDNITVVVVRASDDAVAAQ